jgi:hypothetical protein
MKRYGSKNELQSKSVVALTRSHLAMGSKSLVNSMLKMPRVKSKTNLSSKERVPRKTRSKKTIKRSLSKSMYEPRPDEVRTRLVHDISASYLERMPEDSNQYMNILQNQSQQQPILTESNSSQFVNTDRPPKKTVICQNFTKSKEAL